MFLLGDRLCLYHYRCIWTVIQIAIVHVSHPTIHLLGLQQLVASKHLCNPSAVAIGIDNLERDAIAVLLDQALKLVGLTIYSVQLEVAR